MAEQSQTKVVRNYKLSMNEDKKKLIIAQAQLSAGSLANFLAYYTSQKKM